MKLLAFLAAALSIGSAAPAQSRDTVRIEIGHGSNVWIEGTSNVADWKCRAVAFDARVELESALRNEDLTAALRVINVRVAVRDLKCGNRKMDHDLYAALNASDPAKPSYILGRFGVLTDSAKGADIATRGPLVVAGVEKMVDVPVTTIREPDGSVRAKGAVGMLMTDFGIKPPTGLFGLIRSRNEIAVKFDLVVTPRPVAVP